MPPITEIQWSPDESTFAQQGGDNTLLVSVSESGGVLFDLQNGALVGFTSYPNSTIQLRTITGELIRERVLPAAIAGAVVTKNRIFIKYTPTSIYTLLNYNLETVGNLNIPTGASGPYAFDEGFAYVNLEEVIDGFYPVGTLYGIDLNGSPIWSVRPQKGIIGALGTCGNNIFAQRLNNSEPFPPATTFIRVDGSDGSMSDVFNSFPANTPEFSFSNPTNAAGYVRESTPQDLVILEDNGAGQYPTTLFTTPYKSIAIEGATPFYTVFSSAFMYSTGPNSNALDAPLGVYDALNNNQLAWNGPTGWICVGAMLFN